MRRALLVGLVLAAIPGSAEGADTVLAPAPGAAGLTAQSGQVVFSRQEAGRWTLVRWHNGVVDALPVASRAVPFDADAGTDKDGRPVLTYSRCASDAPSPQGLGGPRFSAGRGCSLRVLPLTGAATERRLSVPGGGSLTTPSMWKGALAFARTARPGAQPTLGYLPAGATHVQTLGAGPVQSCYSDATSPNRCGDQSIDQLDLGPAGVAYLWDMQGGQVYGTGVVWNLRLAPVDGGRSQPLDSGLISGTCGYRMPRDASAQADPISYLVTGADCDVTATQFATTAVRSGAHQEGSTPGGVARAGAHDGDTTYWLRTAARTATDTGTPCTGCELVASTGTPLQDARPRGRVWADADYDVVRSHAGYSWADGPDGVQLLRPPATIGCAPSRVTVPLFVSARWSRGAHTVTVTRVGRSRIGQPITRPQSAGGAAGYTNVRRCGERLRIRYTVQTESRKRSVTYGVRRNE